MTTSYSNVQFDFVCVDRETFDGLSGHVPESQNQLQTFMNSSPPSRNTKISKDERYYVIYESNHGRPQFQYMEFPWGHQRNFETTLMPTLEEIVLGLPMKI